MLTRRKLLDLHIGNELYTMYECKGEVICAYQVFVDGKPARTFTNLFKCSRFLLDKWEESKKMNEEINITMHVEIPKHNPKYRYVILSAEKDGKKYEHGRVYPNYDDMPYQIRCNEIAHLCVELLEVIP